jgi:hypothetical protein
MSGHKFCSALLDTLKIVLRACLACNLMRKQIRIMGKQLHWCLIKLMRTYNCFRCHLRVRQNVICVGINLF